MKSNRYFKFKEFACKCGKCKTKPDDIRSELIAVLTLVRMHFNRPVTITSGYRCLKHNGAVGGAPKSKHPLGMAADIVVEDVPTKDVYKFLDTVFPNTYGLGLSERFTHIDVRPNKARWTYG